MKHLQEFIEKLYEDNAVHRKGFAIRDATPQLAGANLVEEIGELLLCIELKHDKITVLNEAADVMAVFLHLLKMLDLVLDEVEEAAIVKLGMRFKVLHE